LAHVSHVLTVFDQQNPDLGAGKVYELAPFRLPVRMYVVFVRKPVQTLSRLIEDLVVQSFGDEAMHGDAAKLGRTVAPRRAL